MIDMRNRVIVHHIDIAASNTVVTLKRTKKELEKKNGERGGGDRVGDKLISELKDKIKFCLL